MSEKKSTNGARERKASSDGRPWPTDRWKTAEEAEAAAESFLDGAYKLITPGRRSHWAPSEAEHLGLRIVMALQALFQGVPSAENLPALRAAASALIPDGEPTLTAQRIRCVEAIIDFARHSQRPEWQADPGMRRHGLKGIVHNFAVADPGLAKVFPLWGEWPLDRLDALGKRLQEYDPAPHLKPPGAPRGKSAERILAEIIVIDCGGDALGFGELLHKRREDGQADEDMIEFVRGKLAKHVSELFSSVE